MGQDRPWHDENDRDTLGTMKMLALTAFTVTTLLSGLCPVQMMAYAKENATQGAENLLMTPVMDGPNLCLAKETGKTKTVTGERQPCPSDRCFSTQVPTSPDAVAFVRSPPQEHTAAGLPMASLLSTPYAFSSDLPVLSASPVLLAQYITTIVLRV